MSNAVVDSLTLGFVLGAALGDVGAEHRADPWVGGEAPGELLAIWIPTVVLSQVSAKHKASAAAAVVAQVWDRAEAPLTPLTCRRRPEV